MDSARESRVLNSDPVAMHLLVETAIGDSQNFEVLSIEEVEALKQEQKTLDTRLRTVRKKLESETKIRDAARSLNRLSKKSIGHRRGLSSRSSNAIQDPSAQSEEELNSSNQKVEELTRELLGIEARMRVIDVQLLMHTAAVLQLTHNGPTRKSQNAQVAPGVQRPDSPASLDIYETSGKPRSKREDEFDERSFYRTAENLDSLMNALQNGTHNRPEPIEQHSEDFSENTRRIQELNARVRQLVVQANPERNRDYSMPPRVPNETLDPSAVEEQLEFLDQAIHDVTVELENTQDTSKQSLATIESRLERVNNQLYNMLGRSDEKALPPPPGGSQEQLIYVEDSLYSLEQMHSSMSEQLEELREQADSMAGQMEQLRSQLSSNQDSQYEATLMGLWSIIQAGEEEARQRKRQRRELLASDPDADEEISPDEDYDPNEQFSLNAFSAKVQYLYSRASSLKEKQSILVRQIKQQRELNSRSDAQKEEQFGQLKERILSARSEKVSMEKELERAMEQLRQFDQEKADAEANALRDAQERIEVLESRLTEAQDDARVEAATLQAERAQAVAKIEEVNAALREMTTEKEAAEARGAEAYELLNTKEAELRDLESEVVRLTTEVTLAKAELDGAYGTRAERAAESGAPIKRELEELSAQNAALLTEIGILQKAQEAASQSEAEARESERRLKQELLDMTADYEALTRDLIQNEKDRDVLEAAIDKLRDEKEALELELSDERVKGLGIRSPGAPNGTPGSAEAISIRMLREDFRKMMRDRTAEGLRALRVSFYNFNIY
jgi:chromosome segregation ATPase